jgi:DNA-binding NtrC family response regulator
VPRYSILLVEPDPLHLESAKRVLESAGFQVMSTSTFDDAKRALASDPPDILITGLRLGAYNGLHLVLRSRMDHPRMSAIVTSEFADRVLEAEAERQNAAFLIRPFDDGQLLSTVCRCMHGRITASSPSQTETTAP